MFKAKTWAFLIFAAVVLIAALSFVLPKSETPILPKLELENSGQVRTIIGILESEAEKGRETDQTIIVMTDEKGKYKVPAFLAASAALNFYQREISGLPDSCQQKTFLQQNLVQGLLSYGEWLVAADKKERKIKLKAVAASLKAIDQMHISLIM